MKTQLSTSTQDKSILSVDNRHFLKHPHRTHNEPKGSSQADHNQPCPTKIVALSTRRASIQVNIFGNCRVCPVDDRLASTSNTRTHLPKSLRDPALASTTRYHLIVSQHRTCYIPATTARIFTRTRTRNHVASA